MHVIGCAGGPAEGRERPERAEQCVEADPRERPAPRRSLDDREEQRQHPHAEDPLFRAQREVGADHGGERAGVPDQRRRRARVHRQRERQRDEPAEQVKRQ